MLTILVVDDEKLERKGIRFLLNRRSEEMKFWRPANGKAAAKFLHATDSGYYADRYKNAVYGWD